MTDLASWLLAQIAADEAAARAAYDEASDYRVVGSELAELHFVNWKPDRVLADCAAKKAIVELAMMQAQPTSGYDVGQDAIRLLAQPFADREGFDPDWRIDP